MLVIFTTIHSIDEAENLAKQIIEAKLAACVQILPPIKSYYFWEGKVRNDPEYLLLVKTIEEKYAELEAFINKNHSYDVPEIVAVSSEKVSQKYLAWINEFLQK